MNTTGDLQNIIGGYIQLTECTRTGKQSEIYTVEPSLKDKDHLTSKFYFEVIQKSLLDTY